MSIWTLGGARPCYDPRGPYMGLNEYDMISNGAYIGLNEYDMTSKMTYKGVSVYAMK